MRLSETDLGIIALLEAKKKRIKKLKKANDQLAQTSGGNAALLRAQNKHSKWAKRPVSESVRLVDATNATPPNASSGVPVEGPMVRVVLITEGLGNRRDMNYYGPEAMDSAPAVFEGSHCFLNHPSYTEERDIPERRVQDMCGYFKNVNVTVIDGLRSVIGELHFDLSESGRMAFDKMQTALHYQFEFPGSDKEYVGLSVNADGLSEPKQINLDGENSEVNYVTQFTDAMSCDIVTIPARGGKVLALVESAAGANMKNKEVRKMLVKELQAAQSDLKEAIATSDPEKKAKKLAEAQKRYDAILKDVLESASKKKGDAADDEPEDGAEAADAPDEADKAKSILHKAAIGAAKKKLDSMGNDPVTAPVADVEADAPAKEADEALESNRLAVKQLVLESKLDADYFDMNDLAQKGLKEAKREIARVKRLSESMGKKMLAIVSEVSPSHAAKMTESGKSGKAADNSDLFAGCSL